MSAKRTSALIFGALIYSSLSDAKIAHCEMRDALFQVSENTALWRISFGFSHRTCRPSRRTSLEVHQPGHGARSILIQI